MLIADMVSIQSPDYFKYGLEMVGYLVTFVSGWGIKWLDSKNKSGENQIQLEMRKELLLRIDRLTTDVTGSQKKIEKILESRYEIMSDKVRLEERVENLEKIIQDKDRLIQELTNKVSWLSAKLELIERYWSEQK